MSQDIENSFDDNSISSLRESQSADRKSLLNQIQSLTSSTRRLSHENISDTHHSQSSSPSKTNAKHYTVKTYSFTLPEKASSSSHLTKPTADVHTNPRNINTSSLLFDFPDVQAIHKSREHLITPSIPGEKTPLLKTNEISLPSPKPSSPMPPLRSIASAERLLNHINVEVATEPIGKKQGPNPNYLNRFNLGVSPQVTSSPLSASASNLKGLVSPRVSHLMNIKSYHDPIPPVHDTLPRSSTYVNDIPVAAVIPQLHPPPRDSPPKKLAVRQISRLSSTNETVLSSSDVDGEMVNTNEEDWLTASLRKRLEPILQSSHTTFLESKKLNIINLNRRKTAHNPHYPSFSVAESHKQVDHGHTADGEEDSHASLGKLLERHDSNVIGEVVSQSPRSEQVKFQKTSSDPKLLHSSSRRNSVDSNMLHVPLPSADNLPPTDDTDDLHSTAPDGDKAKAMTTSSSRRKKKMKPSPTVNRTMEPDTPILVGHRVQAIPKPLIDEHGKASESASMNANHSSRVQISSVGRFKKKKLPWERISLDRPAFIDGASIPNNLADILLPEERESSNRPRSRLIATPNFHDMNLHRSRKIAPSDLASHDKSAKPNTQQIMSKQHSSAPANKQLAHAKAKSTIPWRDMRILLDHSPYDPVERMMTIRQQDRVRHAFESYASKTKTLL
jgi:hypothetical protein